jgi:hypothetical protein
MHPLPCTRLAELSPGDVIQARLDHASGWWQRGDAEADRLPAFVKLAGSEAAQRIEAFAARPIFASAAEGRDRPHPAAAAE